MDVLARERSPTGHRRIGSHKRRSVAYGKARSKTSAALCTDRAGAGASLSIDR